MPKTVSKSNHLRWPREANTNWELNCPACQRTLGYQPIHVAEIREPKFTCLFCGKRGEAIWNRNGQTKLQAGSKQSWPATDAERDQVRARY